MRAPQEPFPDIPAWESITISRRGDRPGVRQVLRYAASDVLPLNGTGAWETDPALLLALARFGGVSCVLLGQDRRHQEEVRPLGPAALRVARRGMRLASELGLPLVTVIDTPGAAMSPEAKRGGLAGEIARCLADLVDLDTPTLSLLLGQGGGGAALALIPCDRVLVAQHGWLSPLPPEGASAIVHRDVEHAPHIAAAQGVRSADLLAGGIADRIVAEHPDAAEEPQAFCRRVGRELERELAVLLHIRRPELLTERLRRYRVIGSAADTRHSATAPGTAADDAVA
ncbi:carboxyl transferase domain-containing protein [Nonomuraea diastatica]|uniref:carboxyl transferase domain-containing protein n=1 Tax=Nonomuraea diastatica TaxID=1848329 RepID=UPI0024825A92|nr:carboxyl transferase domain-containing protein [Nonomuraea diastatica]